MSRLTKALHFFLYDQYDVGEYTNNEESIIEDLKLISCNVVNRDENGLDVICPYRNYGMEALCPYIDRCKHELNSTDYYINCGIDEEKVYDKFFEDVIRDYSEE